MVSPSALLICYVFFSLDFCIELNTVIITDQYSTCTSSATGHTNRLSVNPNLSTNQSPGTKVNERLNTIPPECMVANANK